LIYLVNLIIIKILLKILIKWLEENAYRFGFILRYPEDKVKVTGYSYEAWHFRYVGKEIAKYVYENIITFEEYYAYFIEK